ncbi:MAG: rRNA maturation RNase YbeY [Lachnospira sp.]|nr:rRNA maturation RNase YbeY [Lachnospira sp.]
MSYTIEFEADNKLDVKNCEELIIKVIEASLDYEGCPYEAEVSVTLTDNDNIKCINKEFRNIDKPTDVLSFPMIEYEVAGEFDFLEDDMYIDCFNPESGELLLGDIVLSMDKIIEQADSYGHTQVRELAFLVAHSMLHLFGYDHIKEDEAKVMEAKQEEILQKLSISR